jgi:hypothetical protein
MRIKAVFIEVSPVHFLQFMKASRDGLADIHHAKQNRGGFIPARKGRIFFAGAGIKDRDAATTATTSPGS